MKTVNEAIAQIANKDLASCKIQVSELIDTIERQIADEEKSSRQKRGELTQLKFALVSESRSLLCMADQMKKGSIERDRLQRQAKGLKRLVAEIEEAEEYRFPRAVRRFCGDARLGYATSRVFA